MGRLRKHDLHLPKGLFRRGGSYYFVTHGEWIPLGNDEARAIEAAKNARFARPAVIGQAHLARLLKRARANAKPRSITFDLTLADLAALYQRSRGRCELSGIRFAQGRVGTKEPWMPSIDRISASAGYTRENCRLVCVIVNFALNDFGTDALVMMARAVTKNTRRVSKILPEL